MVDTRTQARTLLASKDREQRFEGAAQLHEAAWAGLQAIDEMPEPPTPEVYIAMLADACTDMLDAFDPRTGARLWDHMVHEARRLSVPLTLRQEYIDLKRRVFRDLNSFRTAAADLPPKAREVLAGGDFSALGSLDRRRMSAWLESVLPRFVGMGLLWGVSGVVAFYDERYERAWRDMRRVERLPPVEVTFGARLRFMAERGLAPAEEGRALLEQMRREEAGEEVDGDTPDDPRIP